MKGAIYFISKYGSTAQYANWIGRASGLPVRCVNNSNVDPMAYDFLIIASPVVFGKLLIGEWVKDNLAAIDGKPVIMVTVSGPQLDPDLDTWLGDSLPPELVSRMKHIALRGRRVFRNLTWYDRLMLRVEAMRARDQSARKEKLEDFDFVDKSCIYPVENLAREMQLSKAAHPHILS